MEEPRGKMHPPPRPTTPRVAPWDAVQELCDRLDRLIAALEGLTPGEFPSIEAEIKAVWEAGDIIKILDFIEIRAVGVTNTEMLQWTKGKRLILKVTSTLDQAITVQVVGNIDDAIFGAVNINAPLPCAALSNITVGLAWDDWHPYIGAVLTHAVAPTQGIVKVEAVIQE